MAQWYPRDTRWHGTQKHYYSTANVKSLILIGYVILIIVESSLLRQWIRGRDSMSTTSGPWSFWARTGIYLIVDAVLSIISAFFIWRQKWHPIAAMVTAILAFGLWLAGCVINALIVYSNEYYFDQLDAWRRIGYAEVGLQVAIALCYFVMMGFAAKAVHDWRKGKAGMGVRSEADRRVDDLVLEERGEVKRGAGQGGVEQHDSADHVRTV